MLRKLLLVTISCLFFNQVKGQEETSFGVLPTEIPTHNLVKYNRFYFNPTFSLVRENKKSINIYNKTQWASFNDNPQTYLINYTANFDEKTGVSIGLHQQNEGVYRFFGGVVNYAYNLEFGDDMNFAFGLNLGFSQSGIKSNIDSATSILLNNGVEVTDPVILNYENSSVFLLTPGVNFNYAEFDVGVSVANLVAYNLSASELATDNMAFTGHVMYTTSLERRSDKTIRGMVYANMLADADLRYGGSAIVELPKLGWAQAGYNSFYGASVGVGANITPNVSVGYNFETGFGDTSGLGATHEIGLAYNFDIERRSSRSRSRSKTSSQKAYEARDSEIRRLKKEILEQNRLIRDLQNRGGGRDSLSQAQRAMSRLEKSIAEAKEEEARKARELELQREEEVKLLNRQAEEERLASQRRLEAEMTEQKAEEERLASQRRLEAEIAEQKAEEERLASQKRLEAEMTEQKAEEERLASQKRLEVEMAEQKAEEDKIAAEEAAREAEAAKQQQEEERLASQKKLQLEMAEQKRAEEEAAGLAEAERLRQEEEAARLAEEERLKQEAEAARLAEEERLRQEAEAARLAEEERLRQEAEAARLAEEERLRQEAEAARLAEEERLRQEAETARLAEEERLRQEAEAARLAEEERLRQEAEAARLAEEERLRQEAEAARLAEEERLKQEAEAARLAEEERLRQEAEAARLAEEERLKQEAEAARLAEVERLRLEAEAARLAEEERLKQEAEASRLAEAERLRLEQEAAQNQDDNQEGLAEIKKELDNSSRITNKLIASRDSLLTSSANVDKREFSKILESLMTMNEDADEVKKDSNPSSSKRLVSRNRFIKFAETSRPEAQYATKYIPGYPEGYYLIGNVFKGGEYANKFSKTLNDLGFNDSQIILNPENQFQYVSIQSYTSKEEAAENYLNNIGNKYYGDMWILHIAKSRVESFKKLLQETRSIKETVKDDTVLTENLSYIGGHNIENGYYLITDIYKRENYFDRGMSRLRALGLEPQYFRNPKDNYIYVYLKRFDNLEDAKQGLFSNLNNTYDGNFYILKIQ